MIKTDNTMPTAGGLPSFFDATKHVQSLEERLDALDSEIERAEQALGTDYLAVAEGARVPAHDELTALIAERHAMNAMLKKAREVLVVVERRNFATGLVWAADDIAQDFAARTAIAAQAPAVLTQLIRIMDALYDNGERIITQVHALRGRSTLTKKGHVVAELNHLAHYDHLQHLVEMDLHKRSRGSWGYERLPPYHIPFIDEGVQSASAAFLSEFAALTGLDELDPADVAAIRAEKRGEGAGTTRTLRLGGETDVEALLLTLPDLDTGPDDSKQGG